MSGFIEGEDRHQATLFPESLDKYIAKDGVVRVIDVFIDDLDISGLGFKTEPASTGQKPQITGVCRAHRSRRDSGHHVGPTNGGSRTPHCPSDTAIWASYEERAGVLDRR